MSEEAANAAVAIPWAIVTPENDQLFCLPQLDQFDRYVGHYPLLGWVE
jgi:hypothetical protein